MIYVVGGVALDLVCQGTNLVPGTSNPARISFSTGGVAWNIFQGLSDTSARLITALGSDPGAGHITREPHWLPERVQILPSDHLPTATSVVFMEQGRSVMAASDFRIIETLMTPEQVLPCLEGLGPDDQVILDGNLPRETIAELCRFASRRAAKVFFDGTSQAKAARARGLLAGAFLVKLDQLEADALLGPDLAGEPSRILEEADLDHALVTRGPEGCLLYSRKLSHGVHLPPARALEVGDTTGAGDRLLARVVSGLDRGLALPDAVRLAMGEVERYLLERNPG